MYSGKAVCLGRIVQHCRPSGAHALGTYSGKRGDMKMSMGRIGRRLLGFDGGGHGARGRRGGFCRVGSAGAVGMTLQESATR